nr:unnamed protein product [Digitaria exilis]
MRQRRYDGVVGDNVAILGRHCVEQVEGVGEGVRPARERGQERVVGVRVLVREVVEGGDRRGRGRELGVERDEAGVAGERRLDEDRVRGAAEAEHVPRGDGPLQEGQHLLDGEPRRGGGRRRRRGGALRRVDGDCGEKAAHAFSGDDE